MQRGQQRDGVHKAASPSKALREFYGGLLASQNGRYGTLTTGEHVVALLIHAGRQYRGGHEWGR